jgi:hypothetical protein
MRQESSEAVASEPGRLRWRKDRETGRAHGPESHSFTDGNGDWLVKVQSKNGGWFWYGCGRNTASEQPIPTLDEAKRAAATHARAAIRASLESKT